MSWPALVPIVGFVEVEVPSYLHGGRMDLAAGVAPVVSAHRLCLAPSPQFVPVVLVLEVEAHLWVPGLPIEDQVAHPLPFGMLAGVRPEEPAHYFD